MKFNTILRRQMGWSIVCGILAALVFWAVDIATLESDPKDGKVFPWAVHLVRFLVTVCGSFALLRLVGSKPLEASNKEVEDDGLKIVSEASDDAYWMATVNPDTYQRQIVYANPVFEKIWGRDIEELKAQGCVYNDWIHESDYEWVGTALTSFLKGEAECDLEFRIRRPDDSVRWVWTKAQRLLDSQRRICKVVGISRDITKRKEAELALIGSENRFRSIFENSQDAIKLTALDGKIIQCNPAFIEMLGYTDEEIQGEHCNTITPKNWIEIDDELIRDQVMVRGYSDLYEKEYVSKNGDKVPVHTRTSILKSENGEPIGFCSISRDITALKKHEEVILEAKKTAEAANAAKDRFLAIVSHELRTPLNPIVGYAEILLTRLKDPVERKFLNTIKESARSMARLITDVLNYAMIESGKAEVVKGEFQLSKLVSLVEKQVEGAVSEHQNELDIQQRCSDCSLLGDEHMIRQVLVNLLVNALKFTKNGRVSMFCNTISKSERNVDLVFEVVDTGMGIPEAQLNRIFEPFEQIGEVEKAETRGVGLGLSICRQLVDAMGGNISVESKVGEGTTFKLAFPLEVVDSSLSLREPSNSSLNSPYTNQSRALVVEDDRDNRSLMRDYLASVGCEVESVDNGKESLPLICKNSYDIIFMDISMPKLNGFETTVAIRANEGPNKSIPIIGVSAHVSDRIRKDCLSAGMNDFVEKPISVAAFHGVLDRWLKAKV